MPDIIDAQVIEQKQIAPLHYRLHLDAPEVAALAKPGQFLHVSCGSAFDPLLRRPFSIHAVRREQGEVTIFYRVAGRGSGLLTALGPGSRVSVMGPLGRGFTLPSPVQSAILVAGGMGIAPLFFLAGELAKNNKTAQIFIGATTAKQLFFTEEISRGGHQVHLATDDGSIGYRGTVTSLLSGYLAALPLGLIRQQTVYSCGPQGMLRHLSAIINQAGITGEVSLEERMACGVGACLACVCKTKGETDNWQYSRVCLDGPVFPSAEVIWE